MTEPVRVLFTYRSIRQAEQYAKRPEAEQALQDEGYVFDSRREQWTRPGTTRGAKVLWSGSDGKFYIWRF